MNAGKYNKHIKIFRVDIKTDEDGFTKKKKTLVLSPKASVKTTRGMTIIKNNSSFEVAYTRFLIRYPKTVIDRDMLIEFKGKTYSIEYMNDINEDGLELELQCKEVTH